MATEAYFGKAGYVLEEIRVRVGGEIRITPSGVPFLDVDGYSVRYFARGRYLRAFDGTHRAGPTFKQWPEVVDHILSGRPHKSLEEIVDLYRRGQGEEVLALLRHQSMIGDGESVPQVIERLVNEQKQANLRQYGPGCRGNQGGPRP